VTQPAEGPVASRTGSASATRCRVSKPPS